MRKTLFASLLRYDASVLLQRDRSDAGTAGLQTGCEFFMTVNPMVWHSDGRHLRETINPPPVCCRQDVAFFDANKTGQLVNRLTADIQEFKSSFKLVISQV